MSPLLLDLARESNIPLRFYTRSVDPEPPDKMAAHVISGKSWSAKPAPGLQQFELESWLDLPRYYIDTTKDYRTTNQVLKHISNKEGGAHYDKEIAPIIGAMQRVRTSVGKFQVDGLQMFLLDMGALVYWLGTRLGYTGNCLAKGLDPEKDSRIIELDEQFQKVHYGLALEFQLFGEKKP